MRRLEEQKKKFSLSKQCQLFRCCNSLMKMYDKCFSYLTFIYFVQSYDNLWKNGFAPQSMKTYGK